MSGWIASRWWPRHDSGSVGSLDTTTRHQRIAQRFLISILQRYEREAPELLRAWADELEDLAPEDSARFDAEEGDLPQLDL